MIIVPGVRRISDQLRACGYDKHYGFGSLRPNVIGEFEIVSLFWRDFRYAQLVVRGDSAPRDLFSTITIQLPEKPFVLAANAAIYSLTVHGDTNWIWRVPNPGAHGGEFAVQVS